METLASCCSMEVSHVAQSRIRRGYAVFQVFASPLSWADDFGTAAKPKLCLRAVAAVKEDKAKALDMFNNGEAGFKDRDLYVWCANASDGIVTAQPYMNRGNN